MDQVGIAAGIDEEAPADTDEPGLGGQQQLLHVSVANDHVLQV